MRVKTGITRRANHKTVLKKAKGYLGRRRSVFKLAKQAVIKAGQYAYRDRKNNKRNFRALWIVRIGAALKPFELSYSRFIAALSENKIEIDRKILADLAKDEPRAFEAVVKKVK